MRYRCATPAQSEEKIVKARIGVNPSRGLVVRQFEIEHNAEGVR